MSENENPPRPTAEALTPPEPALSDEADDLLLDAADELTLADDSAAFPIVGVGASAGGLEAFTQLLKALPTDTGMAFVLVQHLAPTHASALAEILSRATKMSVAEAHDEPTVLPNHVYVIPPGRCMAISAGELQLQPRGTAGHQRVIDHFFRTLAEERRHRAIGVVLSGTATDGTLGLEAIKAEGGITFAQDSSAQHEGMPRSAVASGCVDFVLPPDEIAREIVRIGRHPYAVPEAQARERDSAPNLAQALQLLHRASGVDFSHYKFNTLYRRITRRMLLQKMQKLDNYVDFLRQNPAEVEALYQDILINVTSFFRNPEAFEALKSTVFPRLMKDRSRPEPLRIWSVGCSTGQEAYSLAIAYTEFAEAQGSSVPLQLFATDLSAAGIEKARAGVYSKDIAQDVSPERLRRFFVETDGGYRIGKAIRDACVFSRHNVLTDPPFSRVDLISCRNLLIYLEPVLQQRIVPTLHFALKPAGYLWLGGSETIGAYRNLFEAEDAKHKIYAKKPGSGAHAGHFPLQDGASPRASFTPITARPTDGGSDLQREADRMLLNRFAPPGVLVDADLQILQYRGDTGAYLAPAPGKASLNLLKMLREGLLVGVRAAVLLAGKEHVSVREQGLQVKTDGGYREVTVEVIPMRKGGADGATADGGFLVLFEEAARKDEGGRTAGKDEGGTHAAASIHPSSIQHSADENVRLAQELSATRDYLQTTIEQQEAANEELQSANEEVQSANEELQSVNEELETSKEEIQSANEELATVNDELNNRNVELSRIHSDLVNLLGSVQMAVVLLGPDLRIRRFTPIAEKLFNLTSSDIGRPLADIKSNLDYIADLDQLLAEVLATASSREREVRDRHGHWYSLRLHPYKTLENKIDGVVAVLVDTDELKRAYEYTASIVATVREPLLVLDHELRVRTASTSFYLTFRVTPDETVARLLYDLGNGQWNIPRLRQLLEEILPRDGQINDFEMEHEFPHIGKKTMRLNARRLQQLAGHKPSILLAIEDVTEHQRLTNELRQNAADLSESDRHKDEFLATLAHELRNPLAPIRNALAILKIRNDDPRTFEQTRQMMERQLLQMVRLVDDLLDVSRISRGTIALRHEQVELAAVMHQAIEAARPPFAAHDVELTVTLPAEFLLVNGDPMRLAQIFGNLLHNACKFTDQGGHVRLTVEREEGKVVVRISDDGIGIEADQLPRIFDMFAQIDTSLARSQGGLGIGLTLVKNLVELHGGTVQADSAGAGQGSEFEVRLPLLAAVAKPPAPGPNPDGGTIVSPRRILVVDDNRDSADSLAALLDITGNETHTAYDGLEAVAAAATFKPEVILLDIGLPKLNGFEAAGQIRQQPWGKDMVLVALTGWGQAEDRRKSREAGFDGHLVKPVDYAALTTLLAELTDGRGAG